MSAYQTIVVGTDGSKSSLLAVERAASIAAAFDATLVIGCAYYENQEAASSTLRRASRRTKNGTRLSAAFASAVHST